MNFLLVAYKTSIKPLFTGVGTYQRDKYYPYQKRENTEKSTVQALHILFNLCTVSYKLLTRCLQEINPST